MRAPGSKAPAAAAGEGLGVSMGVIRQGAARTASLGARRDPRQPRRVRTRVERRPCPRVVRRPRGARRPRGEAVLRASQRRILPPPERHDRRHLPARRSRPVGPKREQDRVSPPSRRVVRQPDVAQADRQLPFDRQGFFGRDARQRVDNARGTPTHPRFHPPELSGRGGVGRPGARRGGPPASPGVGFKRDVRPALAGLTRTGARTSRARSPTSSSFRPDRATVLRHIADLSAYFVLLAVRIDRAVLKHTARRRERGPATVRSDRTAAPCDHLLHIVRMLCIVSATPRGIAVAANEPIRIPAGEVQLFVDDF